MIGSSIRYDADLITEDDLTQVRTKYKVVDLKNALDINGFMSYMGTLGYKRKNA
jgi:hypothetical protein